MIYIASKTRHAYRWQDLRARGVPINSTWIDEAGEGQSASLSDLWKRCISEASACDVLVLYMEQGDVLKGAFVEVGAALASGKMVFAVGVPKNYSFIHHPNVHEYAPTELMQAIGDAAHYIKEKK